MKPATTHLISRLSHSIRLVPEHHSLLGHHMARRLCVFYVCRSDRRACNKSMSQVDADMILIAVPLGFALSSKAGFRIRGHRTHIQVPELALACLKQQITLPPKARFGDDVRGVDEREHLSNQTAGFESIPNAAKYIRQSLRPHPE